MLETADRIEASIHETAPDRAAGQSSNADAPANEDTGSTPLGRMLIGCLIAEIAVVTIALAVLAGGRTAAGPEDDPSLAGSAESAPVSEFAAGDDPTASFLLAWRRSLQLDHTATGTLTRTALGGDALFTSAWPDATAGVEGPTTTMWPYRHSRLDGRALTQIGDLATIVHPVEGRRTCIRQKTGFACRTDDGPAGDAMTTVEQAVINPTATHRIVEIDTAEVLTGFPRLPADIRCWEARSLTDGVDQRWGRRAQFCFHDPSGAAVFRRLLGTTRVETLVVESVSETVSAADLDPA